MKHLEHRERHNECEKKKKKAEWLINERTKVVSSEESMREQLMQIKSVILRNI